MVAHQLKLLSKAGLPRCKCAAWTGRSPLSESRRGNAYRDLHVVDEEPASGNVKIVQQPLVRLALFVCQVGLEALLT
jgi:hypothetical protein